jgi:hypothetical protein
LEEQQAQQKDGVRNTIWGNKFLFKPT